MSKAAKLLKSVRRRHWPMQPLREFARLVASSGQGDQAIISPKVRSAAHQWLGVKRIRAKVPS